MHEDEGQPECGEQGDAKCDDRRQPTIVVGLGFVGLNDVVTRGCRRAR